MHNLRYLESISERLNELYMENQLESMEMNMDKNMFGCIFGWGLILRKLFYKEPWITKSSRSIFLPTNPYYI